VSNDRKVTINLTRNQINMLYKLVTSEKLNCTKNITMEYNILSKQLNVMLDITDNSVKLESSEGE
jgi:hypothetical protein